MYGPIFSSMKLSNAEFGSRIDRRHSVRDQDISKNGSKLQILPNYEKQRLEFREYTCTFKTFFFTENTFKLKMGLLEGWTYLKEWNYLKLVSSDQ